MNRVYSTSFMSNKSSARYATYMCANICHTSDHTEYKANQYHKAKTIAWDISFSGWHWSYTIWNSVPHPGYPSPTPPSWKYNMNTLAYLQPLCLMVACISVCSLGIEQGYESLMQWGSCHQNDVIPMQQCLYVHQGEGVSGKKDEKDEERCYVVVRMQPQSKNTNKNVFMKWGSTMSLIFRTSLLYASKTMELKKWN